MMRAFNLAAVLVTGIPFLVVTPTAHAAETVTYEVISSEIATADVEYGDLSGRIARTQVALPWRGNATVGNPFTKDAELQVNWQSKPAYWVTLRVYFRGSLLCQKILDEGNGTCYGSWSHRPM